MRLVTPKWKTSASPLKELLSTDCICFGVWGLIDEELKQKPFHIVVPSNIKSEIKINTLTHNFQLLTDNVT